MRKFLFLLIFGLLFRLVISVFIYSGDVNNHVGWAKSILEQGSMGAYDRNYVGILQPTYPPLALYSFVTSYWLYQETYSITESLNHSISAFPSSLVWWLEDQDVLPAFHKITSEVSDIGVAVMIYLLARTLLKTSSRSAFLASMLYLFNPAVWYNSALWGQLESPPVFFILLSVYLILKKKPIPAHAAFAAALLFKQSSIIFFPAFIIFSLSKTGLKRSLSGLLIQFCLFILSYLPFSIINSPFSIISYPISTYLNRLEVGSGSNFISDHAFNLWALLTHLQKIPDSVIIAGNLSAAIIGKSVFILLMLFLAVKYFRSPKNWRLVSFMGLTGFWSFMTLTRMHERYLAPVIPLLALSAAISPQLWPLYLLISAGHLLNMYHNWWYPTLMWARPVMTNWYTVIIIVIIFMVSGLAWSAKYIDEAENV